MASPIVGVASPASAVSCVDGVTGSFSGGTGTSSDPWRISTPAQLRLLEQQSDSSCLAANRYFLQTANLDLSAYSDWTPIGTSGGQVSSNFDGGNNLITGLTIKTAHGMGNALFAQMSGTVTRVHLIAPNISGGGQAAGIAIAFSGSLTNSSVQGGSISGTSYVGGLVGSLYGTIINSWSSAAVHASTEVAGGLVGWALYNSRVSGSYSTGTATSPRRQGGLFGMTYNNGQTGSVCEISSSYSAAKASTPPSVGGGIMGEQWCFSSFTGGQSFWDSELSGLSSYKYTSSAGNGTPEPVGKTTAQMKDFATFGPSGGAWKIINGTGTFNAATAVWGICPSANSGYPFLLLQDPTGKACLTPDRPTSITAAISDGAAALTWSAPSAVGASAVTSYTVTSYPGARTCIATAPALTCSVTGLTNGQSYTFGVTATNASGTGWPGWSTGGNTPLARPTAVVGTPTAVAGNASAAVSWTNSGAAGVTGYLVTSSPGGFTCTATTSPCTVTGLTNGTPYTFTVKTTNSAGAALTSSAASTAVTPRSAPGAPGIPTVSAADGQTSISWTAPVDNGGDVVTEYTVTTSPGLATCVVTILGCTITGLTNGTAYTFTVKAKNSLGYGVASAASSSATPRTIPGAPNAVLASGGNALATVSWTAPVSDGGSAITNYVVSASPGAGTCTAVAPAVTCTVSGLTNGQAYTFTVVAHNAAGDSVSSSASAPATPLTKPSAPTSVGAGYGNTTAQVTWLPSFSDGGSAVVSYTATSSPEGKTCTATAPSVSCEITGLTNGTAYTFTVTARSGAYATVGDSDPSSTTAAVTPRTNPGAPTTVLVTSGNAHAVVTWSAPVSTGGATISEYQVRAYDSADVSRGVCTVNMPAALSCDVTGLTNGTAYTFAVFAYNSEGYGPRSTRSSAATPLSSPGAPTSVQGVAGDAGVALAWTAPTVTGGTPVVTYTATASPGGASCTILAPITNCDISGLTNGTNYTFTVAATNIIGTGSSSVSTGVMKPLSPAATSTTFEIVIDVVVGDPVAGGSAEFSSTGLEPSSPWTLIVHSTPRLLSSGAAGSAGTILGNATIPTGLEAGWHALTLAGRDYLGREASSTTWFEINAAGELIGSSRSDPTIDSAAAAKLANTGAATREIAALACALLAAGFFLVRRRLAGVR